MKGLLISKWMASWLVVHLFPPFLEDHHYRLQANWRERDGEREAEWEREGEMQLYRAAQQFSSRTMNLDGQICHALTDGLPTVSTCRQTPAALQDCILQDCVKSQAVRLSQICTCTGLQMLYLKNIRSFCSFNTYECIRQCLPGLNVFFALPCETI